MPDQAVRAVHSCNSWLLYFIYSVLFSDESLHFVLVILYLAARPSFSEKKILRSCSLMYDATSCCSFFITY